MDVTKLINKMDKAEKELMKSTFIAPIVKNGAARVRVNGLIYTFDVVDKDQEGWFILKPVSKTRAEIVEEVLPWQISEYLQLFPKLKVILADQLDDKWIAFPTYKKQYYQKYGIDGSIVVGLCEAVQMFDHIDVRFDGINAWFEQNDASSDLELADKLRVFIKEYADVDSLNIKGITPEDKEVYTLLVEMLKKKDELERRKTLVGKIEWSLSRMGAELEEHYETGKNITVKWNSGHRSYRTVVEKGTLRIVSAGLCLSGGDKTFDLTSLVGVVHDAENKNAVYVGHEDEW